MAAAWTPARAAHRAAPAVGAVGYAREMTSARRLLLIVGLGAGCASAAPVTPARAPAAPPPASTVVAAPPSTGAASAAASTPESPGFPVVGIAECDAYLARYRACLSTQHDPKEVDARARVMAEGWRKAGETDAGRGAMVGACKQATDALAKVPGCAP